MRHRVWTAVCLTAVALLAEATAAAGQIRGSEPAIVAQTVDGTTITVEYSRPAARGRALFGDLVPWGDSWTGANWATTLDVNRPVRLNGTDVPAGKYSVWIRPQETGRWTISLDRNAELFHFQKPDSTADQIHIPSTPETAQHVELLTWSFPAVTGDAAVLRFHWGTTAVPVQVVVEPTKPVALEPAEADRYVGAYDMQMTPGLGWPETGRFEVFEEDGLLRARLPFPIHPEDELVFDLVPAGRGRFNPGLYRDGKLFNVEPGGTFEFELDGQRAGTVRLRGIEGTLFGEGKRAGGS